MDSQNNVRRWFLHNKLILYSVPSPRPVTQISGISFRWLSKKRILPYKRQKYTFLFSLIVHNKS